jgi:hypothetical protein
MRLLFSGVGIVGRTAPLLGGAKAPETMGSVGDGTGIEVALGVLAAALWL